MSSPSFPLSPLELQAKRHAILCTVGFLILLPVGVLVARYTRTLTNKWWYGHWAIQLFISGPVIFAGWHMGYNTAEQLQLGHFIDPHQRTGLALLILYVTQLALGLVVHFFKLPSLFHGRRPPQNYFHIFLGLVIFILAAFQAHYGLYTEWSVATGGLHQVPQSAKHAWLALIIIFWVLYGLGMALLPRQFKQEQQTTGDKEQIPLHNNSPDASE